MKKHVLLAFLIGLVSFSFAQKRAFIGISQNAISLGNPLAKGPIQPGIDVGIARMLNDHPRVRWFQTYRLGITHQRDIQTSIPIYSELGFRYILGSSGFAIGPQLGLGYLHAISASPTVKRNDDGSYKKAFNLGRPQGMLAFTLGASYGKSNLRYFLNYQLGFQGPFVPGRAPLLPTTTLRAGVSFSFKKSE
ncbi:MAG: hypothetical protein AB8F95_17285 [Bacteroidia bacterium]